MAQHTEVVLTCDLHDDDTEAVTSVEFGFNGNTYQFELCQEHYDEFSSLMDSWASVGRPAGSTRGRRAGRSASSRARRSTGGRTARGAGTVAAEATSADIRAWGRAQGYEVSERGRIPTEVRDAWERAHG